MIAFRDSFPAAAPLSPSALTEALPPSLNAGGVPWWALAATAGLTVAAVSSIMLWRRRDRAAHGPASRHLGRSLGLEDRQIRLLQRVAAATGLAGAGALMLSAGCFAHARRRYRGSREDEAALSRIALHLFGR